VHITPLTTESPAPSPCQTLPEEVEEGVEGEGYGPLRKKEKRTYRGPRAEYERQVEHDDLPDPTELKVLYTSGEYEGQDKDPTGAPKWCPPQGRPLRRAEPEMNWTTMEMKVPLSTRRPIQPIGFPKDLFRKPGWSPLLNASGGRRTIAP
jgi:hypothetical protein